MFWWEGREAFLSLFWNRNPQAYLAAMEEERERSWRGLHHDPQQCTLLATIFCFCSVQKGKLRWNLPQHHKHFWTHTAMWENKHKHIRFFTVFPKGSEKKKIIKKTGGTSLSHSFFYSSHFVKSVCCPASSLLHPGPINQTSSKKSLLYFIPQPSWLTPQVCYLREA